MQTRSTAYRTRTANEACCPPACPPARTTGRSAFSVPVVAPGGRVRVPVAVPPPEPVGGGTSSNIDRRRERPGADLILLGVRQAVPGVPTARTRTAVLPSGAMVSGVAPWIA